ncbi:IS200/IS605 family transposase [Spirulina major CS-329]|jgi:putative transposase|uniref:IS200/IS605 family transposase n=1 Tax=Spirulina TaxID=1154 RepID=UPI00232E99B5|nr:MULTISPECIES: IS200/IS605 family transposase [Spirulina]MDB9496742.1 IS200/IS605 family transposase [Spirulina subsalsa CS-330]MDB9505041.1 IS200/IS605 family transposase [Spirulina major CS-329]
MVTTLRSFSHSVALIKVHIVFVTKYRHPVITEMIEADIKTLTESICAKSDCILENAKADLGTRDHIHLLIDLAPKVSVSRLCNTIKTVTSREIRKRYAEQLKPYYWKPVFWKRGFSVISSGGAPLSVLKQYIENQGYDD